MNYILKQFATLTLLAAVAMFLAPIALHLIFSPAPSEIITVAERVSRGAMAAWVIGSCMYARAIGYSFLWGLLSLSIIGFVALMFFADRDLSRPEHEPAGSP